MSAKPDLSVIVTFHREGLLAHPTLVSIDRAIKRATRDGYTCEVIFTLDRPDDLTREIVGRWQAVGARAMKLDFGDLGRVRNAAINDACGKFVAIMDGDNLYMSNWLSSGLAMALAHPGRFAWRPELVLSFGRFASIWRPSEIDITAGALKLAAVNLWPACCIIGRELALSIPYPAIDNKNPFEDWAWNIALQEAGVMMRIVPGAGYAYRVKRQGSLLANSSNWPSGRVPTRFFRRLLEERIARDKLHPALASGANAPHAK